MRLKIVISVFTAIIFTTASYAQMSMMMGMQGKDKKGSMQKGMMMMHKGKDMMSKYKHIVYHLPKMKNKLGLSDEQVARLKKIKINFLKSQIDREAEIKKKELDLRELLDSEASVSDVRKVLKSIYDVKLDMKVSLYQTAKEMLSVLTKEQREKLKNMQMKMMQGMMMRGMMQGGGMMMHGKGAQMQKKK